MRKICYITGTRADYGLMRSILLGLKSDPNFDLSICVTGMHLSPLYGNTVEEIIADGCRICATIPVDVENTTSSSMAKSIGLEIIGMTEALERERPDLILLLGDRGETLAAAISAVHLNIPVVHIHGGERSGTVDEMVRHAISKFSHYHFVATEGARLRLVKMGEREDHVYLTGAPGLDEIVHHISCGRSEFFQEYHFDNSRKIALIVFHPVVQEYDDLSAQMENVLRAALDIKLQVICLEPNSDAGSHLIRQVLTRYQSNTDLRILTHLPRRKYLDCLAHVDVLLGNSSSGIIEAASFNLTVVNVGTRQNLRERGDNVIDTMTSYESIKEGIEAALNRHEINYNNIYGDGETSERSCKLLSHLSLDSTVLSKFNAY